MLVAVAGTFVFCVALYPFYIKWLRSKQIEQFIRQEGPASHAKKAKTPTMGGLCFIFGTFTSIIFLVLSSELPAQQLAETMKVGLAIAAAVACGLLGLADDFGKVTSKSNAGISAKFRLMSEFAVGFVLGLCLQFFKPDSISLMPNLVLGLALNEQGFFPVNFLLPDKLESLYCWLLAPFLMGACSNAVNLHDGMDGLAAGTSTLVLATLAVMLFYSAHFGLACLAAAAVGALLAFLVFNKYPAKVFMGDTGSLFLGALMAGLIICGGLVLWFVPLALIYIIETLSVMAQVGYYKLTKPFTPDTPMSKPALIMYKLTHRLPGDGKRLFRMAPIHHHFEALAAEKGRSESAVVTWFWLAQLAICALTFLAFLTFQIATHIE